MPNARQQIEDKDIIKNLPKLILHKVKYCDLDGLANFYYNKLKDRGVSYEEVIEALNNGFLLGALYCIKTPYNEIVGAFGVHVSVAKNTDSLIISDIAYSDKYYRAMAMALNMVMNNINDNIKSKVFGIIFMSTGADKYTVLNELIDNKHPKELTYLIPKADRNKGIRVWQVYCTHKSNMQKSLQKKFIDKITAGVKMELSYFQVHRKNYLTKILSFDKYEEFVKYCM